MYKAFYKLKEKPFQISTDPNFLWLGEKHREALATLKYGVQDNKGFLLITGDVGTGKTTLINALVNSFGGEVICATIPDPSLENIDFFKYIAHVFKFEVRFQNKGDFLIHFGRFLFKAYRNGKTVVLIIDEAQLLSQEMLEQIRLLSNIEKQQRKLLNIFFVGQNEFNDTLLKHENRALRQRITLNYNIDPLTLSETGEYIQHRLSKAGSPVTIFNNGAIKKIYAYSDGYPRLINIICDHALLTGYVKEARTLDGKIIKECVRELNISRGLSSGPAKKVRKKQPGPTRHPANERQPGSGRNLPYMLLLVLLVIVAALVLKIGSSTEGLTTGLKKIEALISAGNESGAAAPGNDVEPRPIKIKKMPASEKTLDQSSDRVMGPEKQPGVAEPPLTAQAVPGQTQRQATAPAAMEAGEASAPEAVRASPAGIPQEGKAATGSAKESAEGPTENPILDPSARARAFIARTGGRLTVHFDYNSNEISKAAFDRLSQFAEIAAQTPEMTLFITGHTDTSGSVEYNAKLSKFRANIVKSYFVGKGVAPEKIISTGKGPEVPLVKSAPGVRSLSNRRVEIELRLANPPE